MQTTSLRIFIVIVAAIMVIAAYPMRVWAVTYCTNPPEGGRLLMLVPRDFEGFVYVSDINGTRTRHSFGEQATDELQAQLRPFFSSITVESVDSQAAASARLASGDMTLSLFRNSEI